MSDRPVFGLRIKGYRIGWKYYSRYAAKRFAKTFTCSSDIEVTDWDEVKDLKPAELHVDLEKMPTREIYNPVRRMKRGPKVTKGNDRRKSFFKGRENRYQNM